MAAKRPNYTTLRLDNHTAQNFYEQERSITRNRRLNDINHDRDHNYPLSGSKHIDIISVNEELVRMSLRTSRDFDRPDKLKNPLTPPPRSLANYEAYLKSDIKVRTKGQF